MKLLILLSFLNIKSEFFAGATCEINNYLDIVGVKYFDKQLSSIFIGLKTNFNYFDHIFFSVGPNIFLNKLFISFMYRFRIYENIFFEIGIQYYNAKINILGQIFYAFGDEKYQAFCSYSKNIFYFKKKDIRLNNPYISTQKIKENQLIEREKFIKEQNELILKENAILGKAEAVIYFYEKNTNKLDVSRIHESTLFATINQFMISNILYSISNVSPGIIKKRSLDKDISLLKTYKMSLFSKANNRVCSNISSPYYEFKQFLNLNPNIYKNMNELYYLSEQLTIIAGEIIKQYRQFLYQALHYGIYNPLLEFNDEINKIESDVNTNSRIVDFSSYAVNVKEYPKYIINVIDLDNNILQFISNEKLELYVNNKGFLSQIMHLYNVYAKFIFKFFKCKSTDNLTDIKFYQKDIKNFMENIKKQHLSKKIMIMPFFDEIKMGSTNLDTSFSLQLKKRKMESIYYLSPHELLGLVSIIKKNKEFSWREFCHSYYLKLFNDSIYLEEVDKMYKSLINKLSSQFDRDNLMDKKCYVISHPAHKKHLLNINKALKACGKKYDFIDDILKDDSAIKKYENQFKLNEKHVFVKHGDILSFWNGKKLITIKVKGSVFINVDYTLIDIKGGIITFYDLEFSKKETNPRKICNIGECRDNYLISYKNNKIKIKEYQYNPYTCTNKNGCISNCLSKSFQFKSFDQNNIRQMMQEYFDLYKKILDKEAILQEQYLYQNLVIKLDDDIKFVQNQLLRSGLIEEDSEVIKKHMSQKIKLSDELSKNYRESSQMDTQINAQVNLQINIIDIVINKILNYIELLKSNSNTIEENKKEIDVSLVKIEKLKEKRNKQENYLKKDLSFYNARQNYNDLIFDSLEFMSSTTIINKYKNNDDIDDEYVLQNRLIKDLLEKFYFSQNLVKFLEEYSKLIESQNNIELIHFKNLVKNHFGESLYSNHLISKINDINRDNFSENIKHLINYDEKILNDLLLTKEDVVKFRERYQKQL